MKTGERSWLGHHFSIQQIFIKYSSNTSYEPRTVLDTRNKEIKGIITALQKFCRI